MANRILPSNPEAERAIFSIILMEPDRFVEIADLLAVGDFYSVSGQEIWKALSSLYYKGQEIDVVSVRAELAKTDIDRRIVISDLLSCYGQQVTGANLLNFVSEVKNKSLLRQALWAVSRRSDELFEEGAEAGLILSGLEKDIIEIGEASKDNRPNDAEGIVHEVEADLAISEAGQSVSIETGFRWLDEQTGGLLPTQCWVIGSYTGGGKSFIILQIILNILEKGAKVILFSTEMDRKINMMRMLGNLAGVGTIRMLKGKLDDDEKERLAEAKKKVIGFKDNLIIYDNVYTVEEIRLKAKKKKLQGGLDVIFIDFIQNLHGAESIYERMSNAAIGLQQIAQELGITVVIVSQVNQASADWQNKEAIEYKGAGEIAAVADVALWMRKSEDDKSMREVILRKVRHGVPGYFIIRLSFPSGRVIDVDGEVGGVNSGGSNG